MEHELIAPPKANGKAIVGMGVSSGVYRGRVRVIRTVDQLHTLRPGGVLVCPTTSAAWTMVFRRAGAIVADTGSVLSHTAIVAREFALPAVVAAANATSSLVDGEDGDGRWDPRRGHPLLMRPQAPDSLVGTLRKSSRTRNM